MLRGDSVRLDTPRAYDAHVPVEDGRALAIWVLALAVALLVALVVFGLVRRHKDRERRGYRLR